MKATDTLETLKTGTSQLASSTGHAMGELADTARKQATTVRDEVSERIAERRKPAKSKRRAGRRILGIAAAAAALGWLVKVGRGTRLGQQVEERIIDLTGGGRTDEATVERLGSEGLDPVSHGGSVT